MKEVELGGEKSFIGAWYLPDLRVCEEVIQFFKQSGDKHPGQIGQGVADKAIKDSLDLIVPPETFSHPIIRKYLVNLREVTRAYVGKYPANQLLAAWDITESINIQYYAPGAGYKQWHTERICKMVPFVDRHLVFMTYLNDVHDQGGTEFFHQKIKAQPNKGLTLVWPADWTHLHRGVVSPSEEKYIITGWFDFLF
jgi:hypothetical protein